MKSTQNFTWSPPLSCVKLSVATNIGKWRIGSDVQGLGADCEYRIGATKITSNRLLNRSMEVVGPCQY